MNTKRIGIEIVIILVLVVAIFGIWWWMDRQATQQAEDLRQEMESRVAETRETARGWADDLARSEAEAAFRSFAGGIAPTVLAKRTDDLSQAVGGLLEMPGIIFVHVIGADGSVLATSDRKLATLENASEQARWALGASKLTTRESERGGVMELAAPVVGPTGAAGYLWMGYDTGQVLRETRPESFEASAAPGPDEEPEVTEGGREPSGR